jgi:hypothetical protein
MHADVSNTPAHIRNYDIGSLYRLLQTYSLRVLSPPLTWGAAPSCVVEGF